MSDYCGRSFLDRLPPLQRETVEPTQNVSREDHRRAPPHHLESSQSRQKSQPPRRRSIWDGLASPKSHQKPTLGRQRPPPGLQGPAQHRYRQQSLASNQDFPDGNRLLVSNHTTTAPSHQQASTSSYTTQRRFQPYTTTTTPPSEQYSCTQCPYITTPYARYSNLQRHIRNTHRAPGPVKRYACKMSTQAYGGGLKECNSVSAELVILKRHFRCTHGVQFEPNPHLKRLEDDEELKRKGRWEEFWE